MHKVRISILLAGAALIALSAPAAAAAAKKATPPTPASDPRIGILEQQLRDIQQQLGEIKGSQGANDYSAAVVDSISRMPGPPLGPSQRMTSTSPS